MRWAGVAIVAVALTGCASPGAGIQSGEHVTVYVSMPMSGPDAAGGRDAMAGARLALARARGRVGELEVHARYLDDTDGPASGSRWSGAIAASNARRAAQDSTAIAYVGDFASGASRFSLPITNEARMLQVSPASAAIDLVQPYLGAGDQVPSDTQPTGERTFGRVIPSDEVQARGGAEWAKRLRPRGIAAVSGHSAFGRTMVEAFAERVPRALRARPDRAGLLYYGGTPGAVPAAVRSDLGPCAARTVIGTDALFGSPLLRSGPGETFSCPALRASTSPPGLLITSAAQDPSQLPAGGQRFVREFRARYGRSPGRYGAYGYEAMAVVLDSIRRAGDSGDDRDAVVQAFFDTHARRSILGTYSIDELGDTTLDRLAGYRVRAGRPSFAASLRGG